MARIKLFWLDFVMAFLYFIGTTLLCTMESTGFVLKLNELFSSRDEEFRILLSLVAKSKLGFICRGCYVNQTVVNSLWHCTEYEVRTEVVMKGKLPLWHWTLLMCIQK
jgi:hypothetical protein